MTAASRPKARRHIPPPFRTRGQGRIPAPTWWRPRKAAHHLFETQVGQRSQQQVRHHGGIGGPREADRLQFVAARSCDRLHPLNGGDVPGDDTVIDRTDRDVEDIVIQCGCVGALSVEQHPPDAVGRHGQSEYRLHRFPTTFFGELIRPLPPAAAPCEANRTVFAGNCLTQLRPPATTHTLWHISPYRAMYYQVATPRSRLGDRNSHPIGPLRFTQDHPAQWSRLSPKCPPVPEACLLDRNAQRMRQYFWAPVRGRCDISGPRSDV